MLFRSSLEIDLNQPGLPIIKVMPIDPSASIAPSARIHPDAVIGAQAHIGEYCVVESDVVIGPFCRLEPYVYVKRWTTMGEHNRISAGTVLGTDPLDKAFTGERSYLTIGNHNQIREHYTISRGTKPESTTEIGDENYIMTSGHIAHNCRIGNRCVIASCALVAGYVDVEDQAFLSGGVVVHQYSKIGRLAMVGGNTRVNSDLPPFFLYSGFNVVPKGLNLVGLKRSGFVREDVQRLKQIYNLLYRSGLKLEEALSRISSGVAGEHAAHVVRFVRSSKRGIARERASKEVEHE
jgi:UDP-N-acetylglucosamine acyltransferase